MFVDEHLLVKNVGFQTDTHCMRLNLFLQVSVFCSCRLSYLGEAPHSGNWIVK